MAGAVDGAWKARGCLFQVSRLVADASACCAMPTARHAPTWLRMTWAALKMSVSFQVCSGRTSRASSCSWPLQCAEGAHAAGGTRVLQRVAVRLPCCSLHSLSTITSKCPVSACLAEAVSLRNALYAARKLGNGLSGGMGWCPLQRPSESSIVQQRQCGLRRIIPEAASIRAAVLQAPCRAHPCTTWLSPARPVLHAIALHTHLESQRSCDCVCTAGTRGWLLLDRQLAAGGGAVCNRCAATWTDGMLQGPCKPASLPHPPLPPSYTHVAHTRW